MKRGTNLNLLQKTKTMENQDNLIETATQSFTNQPLNQILYGPPGTGKTYSTTALAYEIIHGNKNYSFADAKKWFEEELAKDDDDDRQLDFITFHQNYSYEDFIMGIKPDLNPEGGSLGFKRHKGIFYKICERAKKHLDLEQSSGEIVENYTPSEEVEVINSASKEFMNVKPSFETVFAELMKPLKDEQKVVIKMSSGASFKIYKIEGNRVYYYQQDGASRDLSLKIIKALYDGDREPKEQGLNVYLNPLNKRLQEISIGIKSNTTNANLQNGDSNGEFQKKANVSPKSVTKPNLSFQKNYVIIIDEINRANISRVFGELITLIEDDKRWGNEHKMKVRLPDGETEFTVPNNLYIIGTMNTADKSIALLDIALRRRFEFKALYPDSTLVNDKYKDFFEKLNDKIKAKKGIDFTIGHSYFPKKDFDFVHVMNSKVIPLLNEYFYNPKSNEDVKMLIEMSLEAAKLQFEVEKGIYNLTIKAHGKN